MSASFPITTIVYVIFGLARAGAEVALLELVSNLDRSRFRPVVISLAPPHDLSDDFARAGVEVHYLGMTRLVQAPLTFLKALRLTRQLRPSLAHGFMFYGDLTARLLKACGAAPRTVGALHSVNIGKRWTELTLRATDALSDATTAVSRAVADAQIAAGSVRRDKVEVIENGIDLRRLDPPSEETLQALKARLGITPTDTVVVSVGRLVPEKNHAGMLRVLAKIAPAYPRLRLVLVGSGPLDAELKATAAELRISDRVVFAGAIAPVAPAFYLGDIFLMASHHEGLPLVVLEAMAAARTMVLTRVGGIPEVVRDSETGFLVPPRDDAALQAALQRALDLTAAEREAVGSAAREHVYQRYSIEQVVRRTQALYTRLGAANYGALSSSISRMS